MLVAAAALSLSLANATPMMAASRSRPQVQTSPSGLTPASTQTTDLAPQIPGYDKATAIVRHPDGMYETFLVPPDQVDAFIRGLGNNELVTLVPHNRSLDTHPAGQSIQRSRAVPSVRRRSNTPAPASSKTSRKEEVATCPVPRAARPT
jgi:hypothetical protein